MNRRNFLAGLSVAPIAAAAVAIPDAQPPALIPLDFTPILHTRPYSAYVFVTSISMDGVKRTGFFPAYEDEA